MRETKKRIWLFLGMGFGITWVGLIIAYLCGVRYGDFLSNTLLTTMLFLPSLVVLLSHLITGEEFDPAGLGILPHIKGNIPRYLLAYFFPAVFTAVSALLFFASHPVNLDPMGETMMKALTESGQDEAYASEFLYTQVLLSALAGPLLGIVTAFTEELGFRGYLLSKLKTLFGQGRRAAVIGSLLWSVWYLPLYFGGYHYGTDYAGFPFYGLLLGFAFNFCFSMCLTSLRWKTGSVFPCALARSGVDAMAAVPLYFTKGSTSLLIGPSTFGLLGCLVMLAAAVVSFLWMGRQEKQGRLYYQDYESLGK